MIERSVLISNGKGGVGKTSTVAHIGGLAAEAGYSVLLVDMDPQGNLGRDMGYYNDPNIDDGGEGLLKAIQFQMPLTPRKGVRPNLDVIPGGPYIDDAAKVSSSIQARGRDPKLVLAEALAPLAGEYNLILIDSPPGDRYLQEIALCAAQHVLIPTRSDEGSLDGLTRVGDAFVKAREVNPQLNLLGVVLFGIGSASTVIQKQVRTKIEEEMGTAAPVFDAQIRYLEAPAVEARNRGMLVFEYERDLVAHAPKWYERRGRKADGAGAPSANVQRVATTAHKLAGDYAELTTQVLTAMAEHDARVTAGTAS